MTTTSEVFPISDLEKSCPNRKAKELFRLWRRAGRDPEANYDAFIPYSPELLLMCKPTKDKPMSNLLFCGRDSMATRIFGEDWARTSGKNPNVFAPDYGEVVGRSQAFSLETLEPVYDFVSSHVGQEPMVYERLLLPVKTVAGLTFLVCYSMPLELPDRVSFGSSDEPQCDESPQKTYCSNPHPAADA